MLAHLILTNSIRKNALQEMLNLNFLIGIKLKDMTTFSFINIQNRTTSTNNKLEQQPWK